MSDEITPEIFEHMVQLAALELTAEEGKYLRKQLNNQLKAIHELEAIPIPAELPTTTHGVPYLPATRPPLREDVGQPYSHPEEIIAQAPESEDGYIIVPDIPHTDLD